MSHLVSIDYLIGRMALDPEVSLTELIDARERRVMLSVQALTYQYRNGRGVSGISMTVGAGEVLGLVGPNGAGKSTILRCCLGLQRPDVGAVQVLLPDGVMEVTSRTGKRNIGYIPELPVLFDDLSVWDHLRFLGMAYELPEAVFSQRAEQLLKRFGLWEYRYMDPFTFSKGMLQKLSITCALLHNPLVIFTDEPFSGLDVRSQSELFGILTGLKSEGKAIVLCTHNLTAAQKLCDHYLLLYEGRPLAEGDLNAIRRAAGLQEGSLEACFLAISGGRS